ncbi:relaxase/mobilization nuclease domain-containing protein [Flavobacterium lipolyticum]|uniref:Relaxase/mobilization nuclease domain-containing protein n=1 Tax=Flavobacterium lipolyticum TaxID=2893754 RepID=A0ABS8M4Q3_9FLAO|nr:relaxase/mobilization nuclease domain-containing protein [Flavobacterium sp. F-126]MCC9019801.1 relaxase/mobilization nuclease domain-containing protein [Flavobacterium sp. F-126]
MVGKAKSIGHTSNAIDYGKDKLNAEEITRHNVIGSTGLEIENEFKVYQNLNSNTRLNTLSVVLSPEPEDGRKLTNEDFKQITESYLEKMNLKEHQHIAYVHKDRDHNHLHIYVNRIDNKGNAYNDSFIGKKTSQKANEIAKEKGLISARDKMFQNIEKNRNELKEIKAEIYKKHQEVLKQNPQSFQNWINQMDLKGLEVKPTINKQGQIQGFRILDKETKKDFKASEIHRSMSASNLIKSGLKNDLNHNLDTTLKRVQSKQISKSYLNKNLGNTIPKGIKKEISQLSRNGSKSVSQAVGKQKMSQQEFKYLKTVLKPMAEIELKNTEEQRLESISKDIEYAKNLQKIEDAQIDKPNNNLKLEQDYGI